MLFAQTIIRLSAASPAVLPVVLDAAVKSVAILLLAASATFAMRRASAAARFMVWMLGLASLLLLPILSAALPAWQVLPMWEMPASAANAATAVVQQAPSEPASFPSSHRPRTDGMVRVEPSRSIQNSPSKIIESNDNSPLPPDRRASPPATREMKSAATSAAAPIHLSWQAWLIVAWIVGAAVLLAYIFLGFASLVWLRRHAALVTDNRLSAQCRELSAQLGLRRSVELLSSPHRTMPMVWGIFRVHLLLPADASGWTDEQRRTVLLHELAHARRNDCLSQLIAQFIRAVYWFNPLAWLAWRQMQIEREMACDDLVLRGGARPSAYAEQLLHIAGHLRTAPMQPTAIAMARPSQLERRLRAILDGGRNRKTITVAAAVVATIAALVVAGCVAVLSGTNPKPHSASVADPEAMAHLERLSGPELASLGDAAQATLEAAEKLPNWDQVAIPLSCWKPQIAALHPVRVERVQEEWVRIVLVSHDGVEEGLLAQSADSMTPCQPRSEEIDTPLYGWSDAAATTLPDRLVNLWTYRTLAPAASAGWGWSPSGLQYRIILPAQPIPVNHQPAVDVEVRNISDHPLNMSDIGLLSIRVSGVSPENTWSMGPMELIGSEDFTLNPNRRKVFTIPTDEQLTKPGRYQVQVDLSKLPTNNIWDPGPEGRQCPPVVLSVVGPGQAEPPLVDPTDWSDGPWGPEIGGMQIRLVAADSWLEPGASSAFLSADARNFGRQHMQFTLAPPWIEVECDGVWYHPPSGLHYEPETPYPFGPGNRWQNFFASLTDDRRNADINPQNGWESDAGKKLLFGPGKHTARLAITLLPAEGLSGKSLRLVSNAVEMQQAPPGTQATTQPATAPAATQPTGASDDAVYAAKLAAANRRLDRVKKEHDAGLVGPLDYERAKGDVLILQAEHTGDPVKLAEARLAAAKGVCIIVQSEANAGLASVAELHDAEGEVKVRQAELDALVGKSAPATQPSTAPAGASAAPAASARVTITTDRDEYLLGENILATYRIQNVGRKAVKYELGAFYPTLRLNDGYRATATLVDGTGQPLPGKVEPTPWPENMGGRITDWELKPAESHAQSLYLGRYVRFVQPGRYRIRISNVDRLEDTVYSTGETTIRLKAPTADEARQIFMKMKSLPSEAAAAGDEVPSDPVSDFEGLLNPVYLPVLVAYAGKGDEDAVVALGNMRTPESVAALVDLIKQSMHDDKADLAMSALTQMRDSLPDPRFFDTDHGDPEKAHRQYMQRTWKSEYALPIRQLAAYWARAKEAMYLEEISFIYECIGTPDDLPDLMLAYSKSIEATKTLPFETNQYFRPRGSAYGFFLSTHQLLARGAKPPVNPTTPGEAAVYFQSIKENKDFRPKDWVEQAVRWLGYSTPYLRELILDHLPEPVHPAVLDLLPKMLADDYVDLQIAACKVAAQNPRESFRQPILKILHQATEKYLLDNAEAAAGPNGILKDQVMEVLAGRIVGEHGGGAIARLLVLAGVSDDSIRGYERDLPLPEEKSANAAWLHFIALNRTRLRTGSPFKLGDPAMTPDMIPPGFIFEFDGARWQPTDAPATQPARGN